MSGACEGTSRRSLQAYGVPRLTRQESDASGTYLRGSAWTASCNLKLRTLAYRRGSKDLAVAGAA